MERKEKKFGNQILETNLMLISSFEGLHSKCLNKLSLTFKVSNSNTRHILYFEDDTREYNFDKVEEKIES